MWLTPLELCSNNLSLILTVQDLHWGLARLLSLTAYNEIINKKISNSVEFSNRMTLASNSLLNSVQLSPPLDLGCCWQCVPRNVNQDTAGVKFLNLLIVLWCITFLFFPFTGNDLEALQIHLCIFVLSLQLRANAVWKHHFLKLQRKQLPQQTGKGEEGLQ